MRTYARFAVAATVTAVILSCELVVSPDSLQNGACGPGHKACGNQCVEVTDPRYQCAASSCAPCSPPNAISICNLAGECAISACLTEPSRSQIWADCNHDAGDGCEVDINHDPANCGGCLRVCTLPNVVTTGCLGQTCSVIECAPGFADCDKIARNGCEAPIGDAGGCDGGG
jgi:hypothetical protein